MDDIAQQTLIAVVKGLAGYRGDGEFAAWINRITARETFAFLKKTKREQDARAQLYDANSMPEDAERTYLARRELVTRLDELPDEQRRAVILHHLVGMSVPELAQVTGVSFDTAKSRLRIALNKLRHNATAEERNP